jgi:serralysin
MTTDLELAVLALDAYNRNGSGLDLTGGVGNFDPVASVADGDFFAQIYTSGSTTVISYRGTDSVGDVFAYPEALGFLTWQTQDAAEVYRTYKEAHPSQDIIVTGQSLGGGLAGFVAAAYGEDAVIFDPMPFERAAQTLYHAGTGFLVNKHLRDIYYGEDAPAHPTTEHIKSYAVEGEFLQYLRFLTGSMPSHRLNPYGSANPFTALHSQALAVTLLYAEPMNGWHPLGQQYLDAFFNSDIAEAAGSGSIHGAEGVDALDKMKTSIAYTALSSGTLPFGDKAIEAMFDDLNELGQLYAGGSVNAAIDSAGAKQGLVEIAVQFAADLAVNGATEEKYASGAVAVSADPGILFVDLDPERWSSTADQTGFDVVGRDTFLTALFREENVPVQEWDATPADVTRIIAATGDQGIVIDASGAPDAKSGLPGAVVLVGGSGADELKGGDGNDLILGGAGDDTLFGGGGDDLLMGAAGDDTFMFEAGFGSDFIGDFVAGTGTEDVIELSGFGIATYLELQALMSEHDANTFIDFADGSHLTLESVGIAQLAMDDFRFV